MVLLHNTYFSHLSFFVMVSLLGKILRINIFVPSGARDQDDLALIRRIDYDELKEKFQIYN